MKLSCIKSRARSRFTSPQDCRSQAGERGIPPPQILTNQSTLSQPGGGIMPTTLLFAPRIFRPSYGPSSRKKGTTTVFF